MPISGRLFISAFTTLIAQLSPTVQAGTLTLGSRVLVTENNAKFNISVFDGAAGYDNAGTLTTNPPYTTGTFGDGTVVDYNLFHSPNDTIVSYASGGASLISNGTSAAGNINGSGSDWTNLWTDSDPGGDLTAPTNPKDFTNGSVPRTFARTANITGTIDISGLTSGEVYIPHGTYINNWTLTLTMTGPGQPTLAATDTQGRNGSSTNFGWITDFAFTDASLYDTITYSYTNSDTDGSRARFMGVILDGTATTVNPPIVTNTAATNIISSGATLNGEVTNTGGQSPDITLYWGDNDGGTTPGSWENAIPLGPQATIFSANISGLTATTTYYYRAFASNGAGDDWANSTTSFTTAVLPNPPEVINNPATSITFTAADLNGTITNTGGESPDVTIYYGNNDGGTTPGSWDNSVVIGPESGGFSTSVFALTHDTTYFYRSFAENPGGSDWAPSTANFTTLAFSLPTITNTAATDITGVAAQVGGEVTDTGDDAPVVTIHYGDNDGGTNAGSWDDSVSLGTQSGTFSTYLTELSPNTTYYFRVSGQNGAGTDWAGSTLSFTTTNFGDMVINEFMAANDAGTKNNPNGWHPITNQIAGTSDDWIEIVNLTGGTSSLVGWHLTDSAGNLTKWTFPAGTSLNSGEFLIVYASGDGTPDANGNLHTSFSLSKGGEYLALVRPDLTIASEFGTGGTDYPGQDDDFSYGIHPLTTESVYFSSPTPGTTNDQNGIARVEDTKFSPDRGYYQNNVDVTITTVTPGATIYYTTDGTSPVNAVGSPTGTATVYSGPITLTRTTPLRAAAVKSGLSPTDIDTHSYFILDIDGAAADGTDPGGFNTSFIEGSGMDTEVSKATATATGHTTSTAQTMLLGLRDIPTVSIAKDGGGIGSGEQACSAEFIPINGDPREDWQINCGARIFGGASRSQSPKKSIKLSFSSTYGPGKLREAIFPGSEVEEFNSLAFRGGYNNSWIHWGGDQRDRGSMIRDQWMRQTMLDMGNPAAGEGFMVHVFINGNYWGVHNLCERPEASHYAAYNGGDEDALDANNGGAPIDGNSTAFDAMKALVNNTSTPDYWTKVQQVIDIDQYINYQIINKFGGNGDLKSNGNWRSAGGGPFPGGQPELMAPWQLYSWDGERTLESQTAGNTPLDPFGVRGTLQGNDEYKMRFADRLHQYFFNNGALTPAATKARWMKYADVLDRAIIAESARWGDHRRAVPYTRDVEWLNEQARLCNDYFPVRTNNVFNAYGSLYPNTDAPIFQVNGSPQHGGVIPGGGTLTITATSGTIYYTTDGSDPRLEGGAINSGSTTAISSGSTVSLAASGLVRMRALNGGEWSAISEATFYVERLAGPGDLAITEIHYNPYRADAFEKVAGAGLTVPRSFDNPDDFEFIEIHNISGEALNLDGVYFTTGIGFTFGPTTIPAGGYVVVVKDLEAFSVRYPSVTPAGAFSGSLDNGGETLVLQSASAGPILTFNYDDSGQWPGRADGNGSSLELINTAGSYLDSQNWRPSSEFNGSPGTSGTGPDGRIVINEVLSHTGAPNMDAIELYNPTGSPVNISGWILSDDNNAYPSFSIPSATVNSGDYVTFDEDDFNITPTGTISAYAGTVAAYPTTVTAPGHGISTGDTITIEGYGGTGEYNDTFEVIVTGANTFTIDAPFLDNDSTKGNWIFGRPFGLSSSRGETLWLLETDPSGRPIKFIDRVDFAAAFNGEALGRWPNGAGTGTLISMASNTLDFENLAPQIGPVLISEVMYHPDVPTEDNFEFVEICNTGTITENLDHWRLRGGTDFDFTSSHSLAPGGLLVIVAFDPITEPAKATAFRAEYGIDGTIPLVGPFTDGPLGNDTGTVRLQRPDSPPAGEPTFYPQVTEDEVIYQNLAPWPLDADGNGDSLNRLGPSYFGNFAASWIDNFPSPGGKFLTYESWSTAWGVGGELLDPDLDGIVNLIEFALGLNPTASDSNATGNPVVEGGNLTLTFTRNLLLSGVTSVVQSSPDLENWTDVPDSLVSSSNFNEVRKASVTMVPNQDRYLRLKITR